MTINSLSGEKATTRPETDATRAGAGKAQFAEVKTIFSFTSLFICLCIRLKTVVNL